MATQHSGTYTATALEKDGALTDIVLTREGREIRLLGPAGPRRELSFLPDPDEGRGDEDRNPDAITVLIGSGTGTAIEELLRRMTSPGVEKSTPLVVVDKEEPLLRASNVRQRFAAYTNIHWIQEDSPEAAIRALSQLQDRYKGKALRPVLNPFYLRLDRDYYNRILEICKASATANFWEKARYAKFRTPLPRILLLTSQYFLMGEIIACCKRMAVPYRLLQVPEGEVGKNEFVQDLLTAVLEFKPDFLLTINHLGVDREGVLTDLLERLRLPLASWFVDNPHLILYLYSGLNSPWTGIFTWDADNVDSLKRQGFPHVFYLPLGVDATRFRPLTGNPPAGLALPKKWDRQVAFVGNSMVHKVQKRLERSAVPPLLANAYPELAQSFAHSSERSVRAWLAKEQPDLLPAFESMPAAEDRLNFETLLTWEATRRYRFSCIRGILPYAPLLVGDTGWKDLLSGYGKKWHYQSELGYYDELPLFYPQAAVNFNCTSQQMKGAVNQRVFDVPATESFLLTDYREQVENLFEPGREIICYRSPEEAAGLVAEYLSRPAARAAVARAARQRILNEHCYEHRLETLIAAMKTLYA